MKNRIFFIILVSVNQLCMAEANEKSCDWLRSLRTERALDNWVEIQKNDVYEVVISKEPSAMSAGLIEKPFVSLDQDTAKRLTGFYYHTPKEKKPYLLRAVYGYSGTGEFAVYRRGNDLLIEHSSLGHEVNYHKSALIINLDFKPEQVFVICSIGG